MSRYIDADALIAKMPTVMDMQDTYLPIHFKEWLIDTAPSIATKQIKYFDEDEKVSKIGSVIVDE